MQSMGGGAAGYMISGGGPPAIDATGGTKTESGGYFYHIFTSSGAFVVNNAGSGPDAQVDVLCVAGGGAGGWDKGGGGGGGGFLETTVDLEAIGDGPHPVVVGNGGPAPTGSNVRGSNGSDTYIFPSPSGYRVEAGGGGGGGSQNNPVSAGNPGLPYPFPTSPYVGKVSPGSGGGSEGGVNGGLGHPDSPASPLIRSHPGKKGGGSGSGGGGGGPIGGGGGGAGSGGPPNSTGGDGSGWVIGEITSSYCSPATPTPSRTPAVLYAFSGGFSTVDGDAACDQAMGGSPKTLKSTTQNAGTGTLQSGVSVIYDQFNGILANKFVSNGVKHGTTNANGIYTAVGNCDII